MENILAKFHDLMDAQLTGMITYCQSQYPFLESSSQEALFHLCRRMINTPFMLDRKATPIRASFEFLRTITTKDLEAQSTAHPMFSERDFVFAIKMFGLKIREKGGLKQFVPDNELDMAVDEEVLISDSKSAKTLEFYVSDVQKRTKIQTNGIESAVNRLLRDWREIELSKLLSRMIYSDGKTIGQAREHLRAHYGVKDHEFVRVREHAIALGLFKSKRNPSKSSRRVTLDEDVVGFVEELVALPGDSKKRKGTRTPSQAVNQALRDLKLLTRGGSLGGAQKAS